MAKIKVDISFNYDGTDFDKRKLKVIYKNQDIQCLNIRQKVIEKTEERMNIYSQIERQILIDKIKNIARNKFGSVRCFADHININPNTLNGFMHRILNDPNSIKMAQLKPIIQTLNIDLNELNKITENIEIIETMLYFIKEDEISVLEKYGTDKVNRLDINIKHIILKKYNSIPLFTSTFAYNLSQFRGALKRLNNNPNTISVMFIEQLAKDLDIPTEKLMLKMIEFFKYCKTL